MARPPRIDFPDALYHVTARGNGRARIFFTDADRTRFLDQLQDNVATAAVLLYAFVLMWSSYPGYVDAKRAMEFVCYDVLKMYSLSLATARRQYRVSTHACLLDHDGPLLEALKASRYAIGSERFVEETERRLGGLRRGRSQDADVAYPRSVYPIGEVDAAVVAHFGLDAEQLKRHGHSAGVAKFLAVELACRLTGATQRDIGEHYGGITSAAVSTIRRKIRAGNYPIGELVDQMARKLSGGKVNT